MLRSNSPSPLVRDFDAFLCASIGEGKNGTPVSVLSALARLDIDPWLTADEMAHQPSDEAAARLSKLIDVIREGSLGGGAQRLTAAQLVELLPRNSQSSPVPPLVFSSACVDAIATPGLALRVLLIALFSLAVAHYVASINPSAKESGRATVPSESQGASPAASTVSGRGQNQ
jgi:hypothetical protein